MTFGNSREILEQVLDYDAEIGIVGRHADHADLHTLAYSEPEPVVIVAKSHPWGRRRHVRLDELGGQKMVRRESGSLTRDAFEAALAQAGASVDYVMEIGSKDGVVAAVARGIGIGVISEEEHIPDSLVHSVRISDIGMKMRTHIICLAERKGARLVQPFFDVAKGLRRVG